MLTAHEVLRAKSVSRAFSGRKGLQKTQLTQIKGSPARGQPGFSRGFSPCSAAVAEQEVVKQAHVAVAETLEGEGLNQWRASVDRIQQLGFEQDQAEHIVGQAFGWGRQAYWLHKKTQEVPDVEQVEAALGYLEGELGIQGEDLTKVIKGFPEVIACSVEKRLKANVEHMQKAYYMQRPAAVKTVRRRPEVLGYTVDCEGSCEGFCNQCWVRL